MPKKGYDSVTLKDSIVSDIDELIDIEDKALKSRSRVVETAIKQYKEAKA